MVPNSTNRQGVNMDPITTSTLSSLSLEALQATLTGLLEGNLKVKDGAIVAFEKAQTGPRGPTAKVQPRLEACQADLIRMAGLEGGVTAKALLDQAGDRFVYTDILLVARNLIEAGTIQESRKGRKATWVLGA
jgi:hypothetical protein